MIQIVDFRPPSVSRALPGWPVGCGFRQIWYFEGSKGSRDEDPAKVSGGVCPDGCPLEVQSSYQSALRLQFSTNWLKTGRNGSETAEELLELKSN
jgi:hypothetical protein